MRSPRLSPRLAGFTLIEIIIVVLVFSVMSVMAYGGLSSVLRTRSGIEDSMRRTADMQRAYQRLRADFQNLRDRAARDTYGDAQAPFALDRDGALTLIRGGRRSPMQTGRSSLERVSYRIEDRVLRRSSWPVVDLTQESKPADLPLLANVEEIRWRFLDPSREWQTRWPVQESQSGALSASAAEPPPVAVELTLVTKDWGEMRLLFRTPMAGLAAKGASEIGNGDASPSGDSALLTREGLLPASALGIGSSTAPPASGDPMDDSTSPPAQTDTPQDSGGRSEDDPTIVPSESGDSDS